MQEVPESSTPNQVWDTQEVRGGYKNIGLDTTSARDMFSHLPTDIMTLRGGVNMEVNSQSTLYILIVSTPPIASSSSSF